MDDFLLLVFFMNQFPPALEYPIRTTSNFLKIRGDIRKSRCTAGINNTGGKFATGDNDTGGKIAVGINDTGSKSLDTVPLTWRTVEVYVNKQKQDTVSYLNNVELKTFFLIKYSICTLLFTKLSYLGDALLRILASTEERNMCLYITLSVVGIRQVSNICIRQVSNICIRQDMRIRINWEGPGHCSRIRS